MLPSLDEYSQLVYGIVERPGVRGSTLVLKSIGATVWEVEGRVAFDRGITLDVNEEIDFQTGVITRYFYLVSRDDERIYWYDPQPHPDDPNLASTHPHHKHVPPDIKRHRVPAPDISFQQPNLPFLIEEIGRELLQA